MTRDEERKVGVGKSVTWRESVNWRLTCLWVCARAGEAGTDNLQVSTGSVVGYVKMCFLPSIFSAGHVPLPTYWTFHLAASQVLQSQLDKNWSHCVFPHVAFSSWVSSPVGGRTIYLVTESEIALPQIAPIPGLFSILLSLLSFWPHIPLLCDENYSLPRGGGELPPPLSFSRQGAAFVIFLNCYSEPVIPLFNNGNANPLPSIPGPSISVSNPFPRLIFCGVHSCIPKLQPNESISCLWLGSVLPLFFLQAVTSA